MKFIKIVYLLSVILCLMILGKSCFPIDKEHTDNKEINTKKIFYGKVVYSSLIEAEDSLLKNTLNSISPNLVEIYFTENNFRIIEHGGLSNGNIIIYRNQMEAWQLDTIKKLAYLGEYSDLSNPSLE